MTNTSSERSAGFRVLSKSGQQGGLKGLSLLVWSGISMTLS